MKLQSAAGNKSRAKRFRRFLVRKTALASSCALKKTRASRSKHGFSGNFRPPPGVAWMETQFLAIVASDSIARTFHRRSHDPPHSRLAVLVLTLAASFPALASAQASSAPASSQPPLLLRNPSLSQDKIAFLYADDVWTVSRQGGEAERLTSDGEVNDGPFFSPDGAWIAYSAHSTATPTST